MNKKTFFQIVFVGFSLITQSQNISINIGVVSDLSFETSLFMQKEAYHNSTHISPERDLNSDGAMSPINRLWDSTHSGKWYIEEQRYGYDAIAINHCLYK